MFVLAPLQTSCGATALATGVGFTVMLTVEGEPVQPLAEGVIVIVAIEGAFVLFVMTNGAMLPLPLAASPIDVVLFAQLYVVPDTSPVKFRAVVVSPLQYVLFDTAATFGIGLTVIKNVSGIPTQLLADGVTITLAILPALPELTVANTGRLPIPLAASPIDVVLFVQLYVVPVTLPVKLTGEMKAPLHNVWSLVGITFGVGLTVMVNVSFCPLQLFAFGVTITVAVTGTLVVFIALKDAILPAPLAARPVDTVLFVQLYEVPLTFPLKFTAVVADELHSV